MDRGRQRSRGGGRGGSQTRNQGTGGIGGTAHIPRPGDWICQRCNVNNFASRTTCFRCDPSNRGRGSSPSRNSGDWNCPVCGESNFGYRHQCHRCQADRILGQSRNNPHGGDEWVCQKCGATNRPGQRDCYKCIRDTSNRGGSRRGGGSPGRNGGGARRNGGSPGRSSGGNSGTPRQGGASRLYTDSMDDIRKLITILYRGNNGREEVSRIVTTSRQTWIAAWEASGRLSDHQAGTLIVSLAKLPSSFDLHPPAMIYLQNAVKKFLSGLDLAANLDVESQNNDKLKRVDIAFNFVERLLQVQWDEGQREEVTSGLCSILSSANSRLDIACPEHCRTSGKIQAKITEIFKPWTLKFKATTNSIANILTINEAASDISSWQNVNVGWLANPKKFQPSALPKMKGPDDKNSGGVYKSSDDYFNTVQSLWNAMTFGDGNAAVSPKCRSKKLDKECGEVLWPLDEKLSASHNVGCRSTITGGRKCPHPAVFVCQNKFHNDGLCNKCFNKSQFEMMGPPGQRASTNIYDGRVVRIDFEGRTFIQEVESRKPPQIAPNWKTTKRLSSPNLVGVVKVASPGAALRKEDKIFWAEIVFHHDSMDEYLRRQEKRLAISFSNICEINVHDLFHNGDCLVIIDCLTFAPEFIPVLKALDLQKLSPLPFEQGALLNLSPRNANPLNRHLNAGGFDNRFNDFDDDDDDLLHTQNEKDYDSEGSDSGEGSTSSLDPSKIQRLMERMIDVSQLDPIVKIRMNESLKVVLQQSLTRIVQTATLDNEQLKSFVQALMFPVHLTQGPPGTGKSYLGVVIVQALLVIRSLWISSCPEVGRPPILVLSYKNHAIDEFLRDLIAAEKSVSLIRIGGSCKDQVLQQYAEQNQQSFKQETDKTRRKLRSLDQQRADYQKMRKALSPLINYRHVQLETSPPKDDTEKRARHKVENDAVIFINNLLVQTRELEAKLESEDDAESDWDSKWEKLFPDHEEEILKLEESSISELYEGFKHYNMTLVVPEVIQRWMKGNVPLPKCCYNLSCTAIAVAQSPGLCSKHQCSCNFGPGRQCPEKISEGHTFCRIHTCMAPDCTDLNELGPDQQYCLNHACFICVANQMASGLAKDDPPRNTCAKHPLCCATNCQILALKGSSFCEDHKESICSATTQSGPCKSFVKSRDNKFCVNHQPVIQKAKPEVKKLDDNAIYIPGKCLAKNSKGKPCKGKPMKYFQYCSDHASRAKTSQPEEKNEDKWVEVQRQIKPDGLESLKTNEIIINVEKFDKDLEKLDKNVENLEKNEQVSDAESDDFEILEPDEARPDEDIEKVIQDNPDDIEESENVHHLREVFTVGDQGEDEFLECMEEEKSDSIDVEAEAAKLEEEKKVEEQLIPSSKWNWNMSVEERLAQCELLEEKFWILMAKRYEGLLKEMEVARRQHHDAVVRAKTKVYENKAVIGGTIVGCITRLEAIRATNPFAVLVEEASEVLEPLLFACLGSSTCKLELIGDHLQLKPSIMTKFQFEMINKVNVSMFERLIRAPASQEVPSTALSTQRRMRKNICDLTRDFYKEIVPIVDHDVCSTKKIGDWLNRGRNGGSLPLDHCLGQGREVPGVLPHVYFWTHNGAQGKSAVGLSRVNKTEADMVCNLAQYLVECGIPKASIAILTPYKGQLMLMRKDLVNMQLISRSPQDRQPSCRLSTVDRFQGDEADIVIISLVIDEKSQTPFVKQVNRMIVLLSRARLGMFIIGNIGYFEGKPDPALGHWQETLRRLREPGEPDTDPDSVRDDLEDLDYSGPRLGHELPICCPLHRSNYKLVSGAKDLRLGFCNIACSHLLDCTHECGLPCHFTKKNIHNPVCAVKIDSPCSQHTSELTCDAIFKNVAATPGTASRPALSQRLLGFRGLVRRNSSSPMTISEAISQYRCDVMVDLQLPCTHRVTMTCAEENEIASQHKPYPRCDKPAHTPYIYPECLHELQCQCHQLQDLKANPSKVKPCKQKVDYTPSCTHSLLVDCFLKQKYEKREQIFVCPKTLSVTLPRCGHATKVPCDTAQKLQAWSGTSATLSDAKSKVVVRQGQRYGPKDHICNKEVIFERSCGHQETMTCEKAFDMAPQSIVCTVTVPMVNPECGHKGQEACYRKQLLDKDPRMKRTLPPVEIVVEGKSKHLFQTPIINAACHEIVTLTRTCGHEERVRCCESRDGNISECQQILVLPNPYCNHDLEVPCHLSSQFNEFDPWPEDKMLGDFVVEGSLQDDLPILEPIPDFLRSIIKDCQCLVEVQRKLTCGHKYQDKCHRLFKTLGSAKSAAPSCMIEIVDAPLDCGHNKTMNCSEFRAYQANPNKHRCKEEIQVPCWNVATCGKLLQSTCSSQDQKHSCDTLTTWTCPNDHSFDSIPQCKQGVPQQCPECSLDILDQFSRDIQKDYSFLAKYPLPTELQGFNSQILPYKKYYNHFVQSQSQVLFNFDTMSRQQDPMRRPLFRPHIIPCFINLQDHQYNEEAFEPKTFMRAATLNGIEVHEWTSANIQQLLKTSERQNNRPVALLFGIAFCINVLVDPQDIPTNKQIKKKNWLLSSWVNEKKSFGFDSLQHKRGDFEATVLWDPYSLIATHRIFLDVAALRLLSSRVVRPRILYHLEFVQCKLPDGKSSKVKIDTRVNQKELVVEGLRLQFPWDSISLGRATSLKPEVQKELRSKLSFCVQAADKDSKKSSDPFSGINLLDKLLKSNGQSAPELKLLHVLELLHHGDHEPARLTLTAYKKSLVQLSTMAHPLYLLALARLAYDSKPDEERKLLKKFAEIYPDAVDKWLNIREQSIVKGTSCSADAKIKSNSDANDPIKRWAEVKKEEKISSDAMDKLLALTGLKKVKNSTIELFKSAIAFNKLTPEVQKANPMSFNYCFLGNAGTGKTTVARLIASILNESGVRKQSTFVETSAQKLKDMGPEKFRELVGTAMDGVLFIDEAYDLDPAGDYKGKPIVSELLTVAENDRDKISIILAGYEDDMNNKLFSFNEGLKSRFELINFEDFDEDELKTIWRDEIKNRQFECDDKITSVMAARLVKSSGRKGFGNARAVRKEAEKAIRTAMSRKEHKETLIIEDVMGETPLDNPKLKAIVEKINSMIGWAAIKSSVNDMLKICERNYKLEFEGKPPLEMILNRMFLGNPGTGKTTCAKMYGKLLKELNFLSIGDVVISTASDFVGSVVGESQKKTQAMLEKARGKVLVLDEAYNLNDNMYGKQVLDVLVEKIQNSASDDIAVLLLGYEEPMRKMLRDQNPGLARRFAVDQAFVFEDYNDAELVDIFHQYRKKKELKIQSYKVTQKALKILNKQRLQPNFGNAGAVDTLLKAATANAVKRPPLPDGSIELRPEDIVDGEDSKAEGEDVDPLAPLDKLYRMEGIKQKLVELRNTFKVAENEGSEPPDLGHFVFQGAPGTGKTTVARVMAGILFKLGILGRDHVEETSGLDLTGEYVGQTKKKVEERLNSARGGVLFIDEAYELGKEMYGTEAMTTLVAAMTDPTYKGMAIIIAGYPKDMEMMLSKNVGLKSRFQRFFDFPNWNGNDCTSYVSNVANRDGFILKPEVKALFPDRFDQLVGYPGWGNARDAIALWKLVLSHRANRVVNSPEDVKTITEADVLKAFDEMIQARTPKVTEKERKMEELRDAMRLLNEPKPKEADAHQDAPTHKFEEAIEESVPEPEKEVNDGSNHQGSIRDPGVSEEVWQELELAKMMEEMERTRIRLEQEEAKRLEEQKRLELIALQEAMEREKEEKKRLELLRKLEEEREKERLRLEAERQKREQIEKAMRNAEAIQRKLQQMTPCPAGFNWIKCGQGWRCAGGSHFVSDEQLRSQFSYDVFQ